MKIAVIDLGTNTFNLLIGEISKQGTEILYTTKRMVKLAEGSDNLDFIQNEPYNRGLKAIHEYSKIIQEHDVSEVIALATSGLRSAGNGDQFVLDCWKDYKISIQLINGIREAELIYKGVTKAIETNSSNVLIMDIGGGSTEFSIGNKNQILWSNSYELGASRIKENLGVSDPISDEKLNQLSQLLSEELGELKSKIAEFQPKTLIGSSGSFDTLADVIESRNSGKTHSGISYEFSQEDYHWAKQLICSVELKKRLKIPGMMPFRAELMPLACILIDYVLELFQPETFLLSDFSLKEGAFFEKAEEIMAQ